MLTEDDDLRRRWFRENILPLESALRAAARRFQRYGLEADDLVHDTFAKLIDYGGWRCVENPAAFAFRVLKNLAADTLRRQRVVEIEAVADLDSIAATDDRPSPEARSVHMDELRLLQRLIEELPTKCRRAFLLRKMYGMSPPQIAETMNISVSTVEKHLVKGLRHCTERMAEEGGSRRDRRVEPRWIVRRR